MHTLDSETASVTIKVDGLGTCLDHAFLPRNGELSRIHILRMIIGCLITYHNSISFENCSLIYIFNLFKVTFGTFGDTLCRILVVILKEKSFIVRITRLLIRQISCIACCPLLFLVSYLDCLSLCVNTNQLLGCYRRWVDLLITN